MYIFKKTINYFLLLVSIITFLSCNNTNKSKANNTSVTKYKELEKARWLIGIWQNNTSEGNSTEIWEKKNDSTFIGVSFFLVGKDTVSFEKISLIQIDKRLLYIPTVKNQNDGLPVKFALTSSTNKQLIFENPSHDYPQKISYTQIDSDSLLAEISGMMKGKTNSQKFPMSRVYKPND